MESENDVFEKASHLPGAIWRLKLSFQGRSLNMPK